MDSFDRSPFVVPIRGRSSLLKPPFSERLRSGSVVLAPGESVGAHVTEGREEAIVVLSGTATVECEGEEFTVSERHLAYIPRDREHNVFNKTEKPVEYVYITAAIGNGHDADGHGHSHA